MGRDYRQCRSGEESEEKLKRLNRAWLRSVATLPAGLSGGNVAELPERILQFGEGNFLRGFADWMVDELNARGLPAGRVAVVQPIRQGMAAQLNAQDGLYTLISRGIEGGKLVESPIGCFHQSSDQSLR